MQHNRHEDEIIFPYIKQIDLAYRRKEPYGNLFVRTLRKPLHNIEQEHLKIQDLLNDLQRETNHFTVPDKACINYQVMYKKLEELYNNLIQHKYLEDEVLFPKAIAIEQKLLQF
jgi:regulator of cell morphogenesis and NO signaling